MNRRAIKYFLFTQSLLINEIESPFGKEVPELAELNFDFQYYEDSEIQSHQKLNYLALLEFWKQYICILHQKSPKKLTQIHEEYMRLLVMIFPEDSKTQKHLKPFEWINNNCKCTLDKAAIFLNPAKKAYDFNLGNKGVPPLQPDISDTTDTDLKYDFYYTKGEIRQAEKVHQYRRDLQDGKNVTMKDEDLEEGSQIKINHTPATPVAGDLHPEGPVVDPAAGAGGDAPADVAQPGGVPAVDPAQVAGPAPAAEAAGNEAPAAAAEGPAPPVDPMMNNGGMGNDPLNPAGANPGMGNNGGGGGFFRGWNPLGFLASSRFFGNLFKPKNKNIAEDHPDLDEPLELKVLKDHAMKSNNSDEFLNIANIYMVGNSEVGIVQDHKKAWKYYQIAADLNNSVAIHNIAVKEIENNMTYALEMFEKCASFGYSH